MYKLFHTDFCLSGMCLCRTLLQKLLQARVCSNKKDQDEAEREAKELVIEGARLMDEQDAHSTFSNGGPSGGA